MIILHWQWKVLKHNICNMVLIFPETVSWARHGSAWVGAISKVTSLLPCEINPATTACMFWEKLGGSPCFMAFSRLHICLCTSFIFDMCSHSLESSWAFKRDWSWDLATISLISCFFAFAWHSHMAHFEGWWLVGWLHTIWTSTKNLSEKAWAMHLMATSGSNDDW